MKRFLVVIPICLFFILGACGAPTNQWDPSVGTFVAQTQTATMWTATPVTPSPTPIPNEAVIVTELNGVLRGADPLGEALDAKFYVTDIGFDTNGNPPITNTIRIHVECEWVLKPSCTAERAFVVLLHAFEKDGVRKKIVEQIPSTIEIMRVRVFDHMVQIGMLEIPWQVLLEFANGDITGDQLAARVKRLNP